MASMTVLEYANFVLSNIGRATIANALNIADKIGENKEYSVTEFINSIILSVEERVSSKKIPPKISYAVLGAVSNCMKNFSSQKKLNERMIIDNFIIELWEAVNGR